MENLISTTDFNIQLSELLLVKQINESQYIDRTVRYAKIMKQPIQKNMFVSSSKTVLFKGWFVFDNSLSKAETGVATEVTNGKFTIYFKKDLLPLMVKEYQGASSGIFIRKIEDLLKAETIFEVSDNLKNQIESVN